jgi:4,5-DOPA dioxygenase extradiol
MPVLFVGHGSPMNAVEDNRWSRGFRELGRQIPRPRAILAVSAHWFVPGTLFTAGGHPRTIHDFGGFPPELYRIEYPAPGDDALALRAAEMLADRGASLSAEWGLDHGAWSVLLHMVPDAGCPVVQLSVDATLRPEDHLALGRALAPLRDEGVLILASGNITHNLPHAFSQVDIDNPAVPDWARTFDVEIAEALQRHDDDLLARALATPAGRLSHPTPDHFLPLLYAAGAADEADSVGFPITGFDMGSLSMRAVRFG